jgi:hypothetical protein
VVDHAFVVGQRGPLALLVVREVAQPFLARALEDDVAGGEIDVRVVPGEDRLEPRLSLRPGEVAGGRPRALRPHVAESAARLRAVRQLQLGVEDRAPPRSRISTWPVARALLTETPPWTGLARFERVRDPFASRAKLRRTRGRVQLAELEALDGVEPVPVVATELDDRDPILAGEAIHVARRDLPAPGELLCGQSWGERRSPERSGSPRGGHAAPGSAWFRSQANI